MTEYKDMTEEELMAILKTLPDVGNYAFPATFYKKYDLPLAKAVGFKEYAKSNIWLTRQIEEKDFPAQILTLEDLPKEVKPFVEVEPVKVEIETTVTPQPVSTSD